jgi:hypothetical protein
MGGARESGTFHLLVIEIAPVATYRNDSQFHLLPSSKIPMGRAQIGNENFKTPIGSCGVEGGAERAPLTTSPPNPNKTAGPTLCPLTRLAAAFLDLKESHERKTH